MSAPILTVRDFCNTIRSFHYQFHFERVLLDQRRVLVDLIEYIGNHSSLIAGADASNESNPELAAMADGDARASDYLFSIMDMTADLIKDYLNGLGCGLSNLDEDGDDQYLDTIASIMNWHNLDGPAWIALYKKLVEEGDDKKTERHCLGVAWLEATYFCANFHLQSFDGNCCSRFVEFSQESPNFGNFVGMVEPKIAPWSADYLAEDAFAPGRSGRIDFTDEILLYIDINTDNYPGQMQPLKAAQLWNDL